MPHGVQPNRSLAGSKGRPAPRQGSRAGRRGRLAVEALEPRWMPSLTVNFADAIASSGSGSVDMQSNAVTNDSAGNVFVTGSFQGTADFDPGPGTLNLTSAGGRDVFVARYTKAGALAWAKDIRGADGTSVGEGAAVVVDPSGNVIVSGTFTGTVNFDPNAGNTSLSAPSRNDVFVAKYDGSGNLLWAKDVAGSAGSVDMGYALAVDGSGNIAVAGSFQNTATFGASTLTAGGSFDGFVAKLGPTGQFLWAKGTSGTGTSVAQSAGVAFDASGNILSTGFFAGKVNFNPSGSTLSLSSNSGSRDAFVQKLDGSGSLVWAQSFGSPDIDQGNSVVADASGNVYVTGSFAATANFNPGGTFNLTPGGFQDPFLLKLNSTGQFVWAKDFALTGFTAGQGSGVALDGAGHVFVAGYFQGKMTLGASTSLTSAGGVDAFVAQFDTAGNSVSALSAGGTDFDADFGIGVNASGQVAIAGRFSGPATFGTLSLPAQPGKSLFIAEMNSSTVTTNPPPAPSTPLLEALSDTGLSNSDGITNSLSPTFDVNTAVAGNLVELLRDGVVVANRTGPGAIKDPGPVPNGSHTYTARQTDSLSQVSPLSGTTTITESNRTPPKPAAPVLSAADDSGTKGDGITNVKSPRFTGTAEPNTMIQLFDQASSWQAQANVAADGTYTVQVPVALADGTTVVLVREVDIAGNLSPNSTATSIVVDTTAPAAPSTPALLPADDSGVLGDGITSVKQPHLTGTAEPAATVQLVNAAGSVVGSTTATVAGAYSVIPAASLADGTYSLHTQAIDAAGNLGSPSPAFNLTIDTTPPAVPSIPALLAADDSGTKGDRITNVKQPHLTGTATAGVTVQIINASGAVLGSATAAADGTYSVLTASPLADGVYALQARARDAAGNLSVASASVGLTIDTTAPVAPTGLALSPSDDSGVKGDGITFVRLPHILGLAEPGSLVQLYSGTVAQVLAGTASPFSAGSAAIDGTFLLASATALADGTYSIVARATDAAGNVGMPSAVFTLTIDTTQPATPPAPTLLPADDTGTVGDGITSVKQPRLTGTAEAFSLVQLINASGSAIGAASATAAGTYTVSPSSPLADGAYALRVIATDAAGNLSTASNAFNLTILTATPVAPSAPSLATADDSGTKGDGITSVKQPHLNGTAPVGTTVQLINSAGTVLGSATVTASGSYSVSPASPLADGVHGLRTQDIDVAGNLSAPSGTLGLTIDTTPPATPASPTLLPADDTGTVGDGITSVNPPRLVGNAEPGSTVLLIDGSGNTLGTTTAASNGSYTVQPQAALPTGTTAVAVRAVDAAGNVSVQSPFFNLTIIAAALPTPGAPALSPTDDTGALGDGRTSVRLPHLIGTTQPGLAIDLLDASGQVLSSTTASISTGNYSIQPTASLSTGTFAFRVRVRNASGTLSPASPPINVTIVDATANDFEGDGKSDLAVYRPSTMQWLVAYSNGSGSLIQNFGGANLTDIPVPGDYDGTGHTELAVFRPSTAQWFILSPSGPRIVSFGATNMVDIPVPGDYDGTGHTELAVFRPSTSQWFVLGPTGGRLLGTFGAPNLTDIPVPGDYDGLGHTEMGLYRPSTSQWFVLGPNGGRLLGTFGAPNLTDIPVPGDYDGLGRTELAVYRPTTGQWFVVGPTGGRLLATFGAPNYYDIPLAAPIAGLKKLGRITGISPSVQTATLSTRSAADNVAPAATAGKGTGTGSTAVPVITPAAQTLAAGRPRPRQVAAPSSRPADPVSAAIDSLLSERDALNPLPR